MYTTEQYTMYSKIDCKRPICNDPHTHTHTHKHTLAITHVTGMTFKVLMCKSTAKREMGIKQKIAILSWPITTKKRSHDHFGGRNRETN